MARRSQSTFEDIMDLTAKLPWWLGVTLAVIAYSILHFYVTREVPVTGGTIEFGKAATAGLLHTLALFGQYILPFAFLLGALTSVINSFKRKNLYKNTLSSRSDNPFGDMSWHDFELLIGEHFRQQGYNVEETNGGADGGVDLIIKKSGETYLVQCKQWKAFKVGVKIVRELLGVMVGAGATGGYVVTSGQFTQDAVTFANSNNIILLDGEALRQMMKLQSGRPRNFDKNPSISAVNSENSCLRPQSKSQLMCTKCGSPMVIRVAKRGENAGEKFWGCSNYPKCRSTLPVK